jgi:predicted Fe-S protein YdhL (DUF1289 family)
MKKVESPCVRNCCLDEKDICLGCFRSLAEITQWSTATEIIRREILVNSANRKSYIISEINIVPDNLTVPLLDSKNIILVN